MNLALSRPHSAPPPGARAINIGGLPTQLWRRRRLFGLIFALAILPIVAVVLLWPRSYTASGAVIIGNLEPSSSSPAAWIEKLGDPADLESQLIIVKSPRMLRLALARPGIYDAVQEECHYRAGLRYLLRYLVDCEKLKPDSAQLLDYVQNRYSASGAGRSRILSIGYRSPLPEVAFIMANALIITYLEDQRAENGRAREAASEWLLKKTQKEDVKGRPAPEEGEGRVPQARQNFYNDLYRKATDLESERRNLVNPGRLVSFAEIPRKPNFPKPVPLLAGGLAIASMLAALVALWRDANDQTVRRVRDLQALTMEPVLASLPRTRLPAANSRPGALASGLRRAPPMGPDGAGLEDPLLAGASRVLYAELLLRLDRKAGNCILVASAMPSEGKSLTAMGLARAAAQSGRRVLVINCDLRSPAPAVSPFTAAKGLAGVLRGEIQPAEAAFKTPLEGLEVIETGSVNTDPALLLMDGYLPKLMSWAEQYDLIVMDGPAGLLPDLGILARHAFGVLWCVRWGHTLLPDVKVALDDLNKQRIKLLGLALTMVDIKESAYFERSPRYPDEN